MVSVKKMRETYKCEECGLVIGIKGIANKKPPTAELTCCGTTMKKK